MPWCEVSPLATVLHEQPIFLTRILVLYLLRRAPCGRKSLLGSVSSTSLKPLRQLTKVNGSNMPVSSGVSTLSANSVLSQYTSLVPKIHLFLEKNRLQFLPGAVYNIRNSTVLSVRDNQLISLLPSITHLTKLVELNLSNNRLRWLPWEIKAFLPDLAQVNVSGNPLVNPDLSRDMTIPLETTMRDMAVQVLRINGNPFVCSTAMTLLAADGSAHSGPAKPTPSLFHTSIRPSRTPVDIQSPRAYVPSTVPLPAVAHRSRVPSLIESVLRAASLQPSLSSLVASLPADFPPTLSMLLRHTLRIKEAGGQLCSVCHDRYIVPRTEWIEWWVLGRSATAPITPLLRFGCSWGCGARHGGAERG